MLYETPETIPGEDLAECQTARLKAFSVVAGHLLRRPADPVSIFRARGTDTVGSIPQNDSLFRAIVQLPPNTGQAFHKFAAVSMAGEEWNAHSMMRAQLQWFQIHCDPSFPVYYKRFVFYCQLIYKIKFTIESVFLTEKGPKKRLLHRFGPFFAFLVKLQIPADGFRDFSDFAVELPVCLDGELLRGVAEGFPGIRVDLDDQPVRAGRNAGEGQGLDVGSFPGRVGRVDDDRQAAAFPHHGDRRDVQRIACGRLEGADPAFAEDDVVVALAHDVFRGVEPFLNSGGDPALEEHRNAGTADFP